MILPILLLSCQQEKFDSSRCEQLSMEKFKGNPKSAHLFKKHCQGITIKNTKERCQQALNKFILTGNLEQTKQEFGQNIDLCFTKNDLKKFKK